MSKSEKEKKVTKNSVGESKSAKIQKADAKPKNSDEDDDMYLDDEKPTKKSSSSKNDDEEDDLDVQDDWEKPEEDDNWDPDFEEFDVPKSKVKKTPGKKSSDEEDFSVDDEFKDLGFFDDDSSGFDNDDDY